MKNSSMIKMLHFHKPQSEYISASDLGMKDVRGRFCTDLRVEFQFGGYLRVIQHAEPVVERLVSHLSRGRLAHPHDAVPQRALDGGVATQAAQLERRATAHQHRHQNNGNTFHRKIRMTKVTTEVE